MKIAIQKLKDGDNPFRFQSTQEGWLRAILHRIREKGYEVPGELEVDMNLTKCEPDYYLRGTMTLALRQTCARCAEAFTDNVQHPFNIAFAHVSHAKARSADLADESDELDVNYFEGNDIDLPPVLEEQFFLSLPYQAVCKPECKGICQHCGQNLNVSSCACKKGSKLTPFSVLAEMKV